MTPIGIGRDLARLARLSEATGLHIVAASTPAAARRGKKLFCR
ncbi:MAG: hypothetical protein ACKOFY_02020 [Candidatus Limnocylindrus sp.]